MISRAWHAEPSLPAVLRLPAIAVLTLGIAANALAAGRHAPLPAPVDLAAEGMQAASRSQPVVILFSLPGCSFCDVVRQNYLAPMMRDLPEPARPVIREVQITGSTTFTGFRKERISHRAFAMQYGARFAPTVILLDGHGRLLSPPIVGGDTAGLYGGYLDNAFSEASRKLASGRRFATSGE